jgi:hypothetical protein
MQPISVTYPANATGSQTPVSLDWRIVPFSVAYGISFDGSATGSVTVDTTLDNVNDASITPVWIASSAITTTSFAALTSPAQFIRVTVTSLSGGTLTFKVLQGESVN